MSILEWPSVQLVLTPVAWGSIPVRQAMSGKTLVPCNCTSCNGEHVSPATRANHCNNDWQRQNQVQSTSTTSSSHLSTSPELDARWSVSIIEELSFLAMIPVVQPDRPLCFHQTPSNALPFALHVDTDLHRSNRSVFALTNNLAN
ncbi:hypothetical protein BJ165DRAFT_1535737 [Panaeolus papilionaceus]|nr:hypothetical protein BJ165DRAFT_1535737 [Panaeolus papilionaceus]